MDELMARYMELCRPDFIADSAAYARLWELLGGDFEHVGRMCMAACCYQRAKEYAAYEAGAYYVQDNGAFVELVKQ